ncbi:unnamed protein product [Notodromas monacha]|uniref:60S ribosomal export protein NMD3 n=1 Tax=Notodromas monacha TaxID=399045 RepID=A0A7R9BH65_9CRUS|nr:unnamed protein product [Notodromas monacha]CAG0914355.1 unnamed protein product [Notodromas monacha]
MKGRGRELRKLSSWLCCDCGKAIEPNSANMCVECIRSRVDITEHIPKQSNLQFCKFCERYLNPPNTWMVCPPESRELLTLCLKRLRALTSVRLIDASFVWTEPHSKRIIVKLVVQKEVFGGAVLQQVFNVEYVVNNQMCDECRRVENKDFWKASVQVRQKTHHKKTLYYLEQLILKTSSHSDCVGINPVAGGIDFFFATENQARKMVDFLLTAVPCKYNHSKKLISHDIHSNTYNYKYTYCVDIVPSCRLDVVCLPPAVAKSCGSMNQIVLVNRVNNVIHLIDPQTAQIGIVNGASYYRSPFGTLCSAKQLVEYVVMDVELLQFSDLPTAAGLGKCSGSHAVADVFVVRSNELGLAEPLHIRSHLGSILKPGDTVLGYDLKNANVNDPHFDKMNPDKIPSVVLVKKVYASDATKGSRRAWKLKRLQEAETASVGSSGMDQDFVDFMDDLEADPVMRQGVNIYKNPKFKPREKPSVVEGDEEQGPTISLEEMLDELTLDDDPMGQ